MASIAPPCHSRNAQTTDSWITPRWLIDAFGPFDLDPCACDPQPWPCASRQYTEADDGLSQPWSGLVWCNPPYGRSTARWLGRLADHGNGVALIFARTETRMFFEHVWSRADGVLFLEGRLSFCYPWTGEAAQHNSGGPSCLVSWGSVATKRLESGEHRFGKFIGIR